MLREPQRSLRGGSREPRGGSEELQIRNPPQGLVADKSAPEPTNSRVPWTCACHCSHSIEKIGFVDFSLVRAPFRSSQIQAPSGNTLFSHWNIKIYDNDAKRVISWWIMEIIEIHGKNYGNLFRAKNNEMHGESKECTYFKWISMILHVEGPTDWKSSCVRLFTKPVFL